MKKYSAKEALQAILSCANLYNDQLLNRKFLFIYRDKNGKYGHIEVLFRKKHFMHLTGSDRTDDNTAIHFFSKCIDNTLSIKDIVKTNMMDLKLAVLPSLMKIHKNARMIGSFKGEPLQQLLTDKLVGHSKGCMGFVLDHDEDFLVPNTVLYGNTREMIIENNQIIAVYFTSVESTKYGMLCYVAQNSDVAKKDPFSFTWTDEINCKIETEKLIIDI
jgi:hypothetical protein